MKTEEADLTTVIFLPDDEGRSCPKNSHYSPSPQAHSTSPTEHPSPRTCSGGVYAGVPEEQIYKVTMLTCRIEIYTTATAIIIRNLDIL
jgi:hypothetical protein